MILDFGPRSFNMNFNPYLCGNRLVILGGEAISIPWGMLNTFYIVGSLGMLALVVYVLDASISLWRRRQVTCRRAVIFSSTISFFLLTSTIQAALVNAGVFNSPNIACLSFMTAIIAMSYPLSYELNAKSLADRLGVISSLPD
jgi:hypothetical protein